MFCQKCGQQNPDTGKFCRACGTDLGNVTQALTEAKKTQPLVDRRGRPISWERAITGIFMGLAFLTVSIILAVTGMGRGWWFWMLIPAFAMLGGGIAKYVQLKKHEQLLGTNSPTAVVTIESSGQLSALPPQQTQFVSPDSRYKTGDLVPPSVAEGTTRHLELDSEGQTMTLPKK
jgi:hypothetical protein